MPCDRARGRRRHAHALALPKVLHAIGGRTLLAHVLAAASAAGCGEIAVVVGPDHDAVRARRAALAPQAQIFEQRERRGTAHAVLAAREAIARGADDILVMFADTPLVRPRRSTHCARRLATAPRWRCSVSRPPIRPAMAGC